MQKICCSQLAFHFQQRKVMSKCLIDTPLQSESSRNLPFLEFYVYFLFILDFDFYFFSMKLIFTCKWKCLFILSVLVTSAIISREKLKSFMSRFSVHLFDTFINLQCLLLSASSRLDHFTSS